MDLGREVEVWLGGDLWCGRGEGGRGWEERERWEKGKGGKGKRCCGCGWVEGLWFWLEVGVGVVGGLGGKTVGFGEGKRREGRVLWCAVMGDGKDGARVERGRLLWFVVARGKREEGLGCDGAEIMGGGWREEESGVVVWWEGEGQGWAKGGKGCPGSLSPAPPRRL